MQVTMSNDSNEKINGITKTFKGIFYFHPGLGNIMEANKSCTTQGKSHNDNLAGKQNFICTKIPYHCFPF